MTIIELPNWPVAKEIEWEADQPSQANRSEFTGVRRVTILGEAFRRSAQVTYPPILGEAAFRPWRAALAACRGRVNPFRLVAVENPQPTFSPNVVVDGAGQQGFSLATKGWHPRATIKSGMMVTVGDRLFDVAVSAISDEAGKLTLQLEQLLPEGLADLAPVETIWPWALMAMAESRVPYKVGAGQQYAVSFRCEEAF